MKFYKQLSVDERNCLQFYFMQKKSMREIARLLGRNVSTISRELKRNGNKNGSYHFWRATSLYKYRRKRCGRKLRFREDSKLIDFTRNCLDKFWSPQIICARWKAQNNNASLSPTTIYKAIKAKIITGYTAKTHLRRHGRKGGGRNKFVTIKPDYLIRNRPAIINNRERFGDWEGDTVCGAKGKGGVVTLVDRKSRYLLARLVKTGRSDETKDAILEALKGKEVNSISLDNGVEFAEHRKIHDALNAKIYFADLRAPWQRGSNENINGLLRFFYPKGCNFHEVTQEQLGNVLELINNRPRKCLGWRSPVEFLKECCT